MEGRFDELEMYFKSQLSDDRIGSMYTPSDEVFQSSIEAIDSQSGYDGLDMFFKNQLSDEKLADGFIPSNEIFDTVIGQAATAKQERKKYVIYLTIFTLGLLAFGLFEYHRTQKINSLEEEVAKMKHRSNPPTALNTASQKLVHTNRQANDKSSNQILTKATAPASHIEKQSIERRSVNNITTIIVNKKYNKQNNNAGGNRQNRNSHLQKSTPSTPFATGKSGGIENANTAAIQPQNNGNNVSTNTEGQNYPIVINSNAANTETPRALWNGLTSLYKEIKFIDHSTKQIAVMPITYKSIQDRRLQKWEIGLVFQNNLSSMTMKGEPINPDVVLTQYDQYKYGSGLAISGAYALTKRLKLISGVNFSQYNNKSIASETNIIDPSKVILENNGSMHYQSDIDMGNPITAARMASSINIDKYPTAGEKMQHTNKIAIKLSTMQWSLGASYQLVAKNKLLIHTGAGMSHDVVLRNKGIYNIDITSKEINYTNTEKMDLEAYTKGFTSIYGNIDVVYAINPRYSIAISNRYTKGLTSLRKDEVITCLNSYQLGVGGIYKL